MRSEVGDTELGADEDVVTEDIGAFIDRVGKSVLERDDFDRKLTEILISHIVVEHPSPDAVDLVTNKLIELAEDRAASVSEGRSDGGTDD